MKAKRHLLLLLANIALVFTSNAQDGIDSSDAHKLFLVKTSEIVFTASGTGSATKWYYQVGDYRHELGAFAPGMKKFLNGNKKAIRNYRIAQAFGGMRIGCYSTMIGGLLGGVALIMTENEDNYFIAGVALMSCVVSYGLYFFPVRPLSMLFYKRACKIRNVELGLGSEGAKIKGGYIHPGY